MIKDLTCCFPLACDYKSFSEKNNYQNYRQRLFKQLLIILKTPVLLVIPITVYNIKYNKNNFKCVHVKIQAVLITDRRSIRFVFTQKSIICSLNARILHNAGISYPSSTGCSYGICESIKQMSS